MKLIMLRHGETQENLDKIIQGQGVGQLTERGRQQAKMAAQALKDEKLDMIFASDLSRAKETLREVMVFFPMTPVIFSTDLRERAIGIYEGRPKQVYYEAQEQSGVSFVEFKPEGGESFIELKARTDHFLERLRNSYLNKRVLLCTHGGPIRTILASVLGLSFEELWNQPIDNASLSKVDFSESGEVMRCVVNSTQHIL